ncbi:hypothetical protein [Aliiruegeria lutimaris]|nr:hypothetical protein [Aliiruegeria lutimaris]
MPATIASAATGTEAPGTPVAAAEVTESYQIAQVSVGDVLKSATEEVNKAADAAAAEATGATEAAEAEAAESEEAETSEAAEAEATETETTEAAEAEATETETAETETGDSDALTTEGFDLSTATSLIDSSRLSEMEKMTLETALEQAQSNPALLDAALQQARGALGM